MNFGNIGAKKLVTRLPYDSEVEYLESTGTQYIDTGITPDINGISKISFMPTVSSSPVVWGCQNFTETSGYGRYFTISGVSSTAYRPVGNVYDIELNGETDSYYVNGVLQSSSSSFFKVSASGNCWLFGRSDNGNLESVRIYSTSFAVGGIIVRDFIPVRVGTTGYMYDRVSGKLFDNQGSGNFIVGPDVAEVEYLEGTGTQWIDTGIGFFFFFEIGIRLRQSVSNKALGVSPSSCMERINASNPCWRLTVNGVVYNSSVPIVEYHSMALRNGTFSCDGAPISSVENTFATGKMTIFGAGGTCYPNMIYHCNLYDSNGVLVRDFVPVRIGTEGAMEDTLTRRFYRNSGTGTFKYGNDIIRIS